jgi:hypothetical protein
LLYLQKKFNLHFLLTKKTGNKVYLHAAVLVRESNYFKIVKGKTSGVRSIYLNGYDEA